MREQAIYLDSSAILKLVYAEDETAALEEFLREWPRWTSSVLARVEVMRLARRVEDPIVARCAREVLEPLDFVSIDEAVLRDVIAVEPRSLRAMDAVHLATALMIHRDVGGMVVYDKRLARAARAAGLTIWAPA